MSLEIIGAESLGVRSLCCLVTLADRRIVIDPGVSLGYLRYGLLPHPLQIAVGCRVREKILRVLHNATDVVFSHFHGDHVPLVDANPYQLSVRALPSRFRDLLCWSKSDDDLSTTMSKRFHDLAELMGEKLQVAEGRSEGPLSFSRAVPHGAPGNNLGTLMMTRVDMGNRVFVHASDIQLLDDLNIFSGIQCSICGNFGKQITIDQTRAGEGVKQPAGRKEFKCLHIYILVTAGSFINLSG